MDQLPMWLLHIWTLKSININNGGVSDALGACIERNLMNKKTFQMFCFQFQSLKNIQFSWGYFEQLALPDKVCSTMLFLLLSSLALVSELSKRMPRKWKLLGQIVLYPFIMHPVCYFLLRTHTWLSGVSLWTYRCRQQRQVGEKQHSKHRYIYTNVHLSIKSSSYLFPGKMHNCYIKVSYKSYEIKGSQKQSVKWCALWNSKRKSRIGINLVSTSS